MKNKVNILDILLAGLFIVGGISLAIAILISIVLLIFSIPAIGLWCLYNIPFHYIFGAPYVSFLSMLIISVLIGILNGIYKKS